MRQISSILQIPSFLSLHWGSHVLTPRLRRSICFDDMVSKEELRRERTFTAKVPFCDSAMVC